MKRAVLVALIPVGIAVFFILVEKPMDWAFEQIIEWAETHQSDKYKLD